MIKSPRKEYLFSLTSVPSAGDKELRSNLHQADRIYISVCACHYFDFSLLLTKIVLSINETVMNWTLQFLYNLSFSLY